MPRRAPTERQTTRASIARWIGVALAAALAATVVATLGRRLRPGHVRREAGLSVLLVTIDTLRADAIGTYGGPQGATPWMDRLAGGGVRFDSAHAHNVMTLPSHANILSGRYPLDHRVRDNAGFRFPSGVETLATLLKARGYRTGAFVSAFPLDSRFGLARGFDAYEDSFSDAGTRPVFLEQERRGTETVALARQWLGAQGSERTLAWVHLYEPHFPYAPPEAFATRFRGNPYQGEVAAADAALGPLLEPILSAGNKGRTLVVLTADHGEALGEHGEATHGILAYEATLRVPLALYQPRLFTPRVVSAPARHVDLLPTILDALSLPVPEGLAGRSLLAVAAGAPADPVPSYFEALSGELGRGWAPLRGVIRDGTKYIDLPIPELYDIRSDPRETRNLAAAQPGRVAEMRGLLAPLRAADRGTVRAPESAETRARLGSLGYVTGMAGPKERYTEQDDPKRLIALDGTLQEIVGLHGAGDLGGALARARELVRAQPGMPVALLTLAQLERENGDLPSAVNALRQAVAVRPHDPAAVSLLGACLMQAGRAQEAAAILEPHAREERPDVDVLTTYALALAKLGRPRDALATLARAREMDPSSAMVLVDVGTVHLMAGDRARAREVFEAALAKNPNVGRAHLSLGVMAVEDGRMEAAVDHWKKAVALDPRECEALLGLGLARWRAGQTSAARAYFEFFVASAPPRLYARDIERVRSLLAGTTASRAGEPPRLRAPRR